MGGGSNYGGNSRIMVVKSGQRITDRGKKKIAVKREKKEGHQSIT